MKLNQILLNGLLIASSSVAYSQTITTVAGVVGSPGYAGDAGQANNAKFNNPRAVATDTEGNLYIADMRNHVIRKVNNNGIVNTVAGNGTAGNSGAGGPATAAQLAQPTGMTIDNDGNIYIADYNSSVIKKVTTSGIMTVFAGNGTEGFSGDGGPASQAKLYRPTAVAVDKDGNLYISDASNKVIRKVTKAGVISTIAGVPGRAGYSGDGGPATKALLTQPAGIAVDYSGNVYIADPSNSVIRKVNPAGIITTFAGTGTAGYSGDNGPATKAQFQIGSPQGLAVDPAGNVYASDYQNHAIRKINAKGIITTIAGTGAPDYAGDGGPAILAKIWYPIGIATDIAGNVFITDSYNNTIREIVSSCTAPTPSFEQQPVGKSVCKGGNVTFSVTANNTDNYQWQVLQANGEWVDVADGANYAGATTNTLTVNAVTATMNNNRYRCMANNACRTLFSNGAALTVTGGASPTLTVAPALNGMCVGMPGSFTVKVANGGTAPTYKWIVNGNDAGSTSPTYTNAALVNGDKVSCVLTSAAGCSGEQIASNVIEVKMGFAPEVKTNTEIKIFQGFSAKLTATSENQISSYSWTPTTGVTAANTANPIVKPAKTTTYKVTAANASGCAATAEVTVTVLNRIAMPKSFTPNGDGMGDLFQIPAVDPAFVMSSFSVLDKTGKVVFQTTDITKGWDGKTKGVKAEAGTYSYAITGTLQTGKINVKGTVQLVR
ncbi:T9SS type B sorting domain-containing protein [Niastella caeni]|uniref:T9SS type B sorting domain-containing protein n=1 Tax=Niastella caeni TaxID=2569763 RepID=A0A4S8HGE2_9BACT|nr:gliding motility-associated C-terminal domain-containing protein [Niastella caeni]THU34043.1 T9SS type B sorting domain-containing protein [Niastella caeni]